MGLIGAIVIGLLAGFLAGRLFRGRGFGLLGISLSAWWAR